MGKLIGIARRAKSRDPMEMLDQADILLAKSPRLISVHQFKPKRAGLVLTRVPSSKPSILDKRIKAIGGRVAALECRLIPSN